MYGLSILIESGANSQWSLAFLNELSPLVTEKSLSIDVVDSVYNAKSGASLGSVLWVHLHPQF